MRAGEIRKRIVIEQRSTAQDTFGGQVTTWSVVATVWAGIRPMSGRELITAQAVQSEVTHQIIMRYQAGIAARMRVRHDGRLFNILAVLDQNERHRQLTLLCQEGLTDG